MFKRIKTIRYSGITSTIIASKCLSVSSHVDSVGLLLHAGQLGEALQSPVQQREGDKGLDKTERDGVRLTRCVDIRITRDLGGKFPVIAYIWLHLKIIFYVLTLIDELFVYKKSDYSWRILNIKPYVDIFKFVLSGGKNSKYSYSSLLLYFCFEK